MTENPARPDVCSLRTPTHTTSHQHHSKSLIILNHYVEARHALPLQQCFACLVIQPLLPPGSTFIPQNNPDNPLQILLILSILPRLQHFQRRDIGIQLLEADIAKIDLQEQPRP